MISLLFAIATFCIVIQLPIRSTALGAQLRKAAVVAFLLALLPSVIVGIFFGPRSPDGSLGEPNPVAMIILAIIFAAASWGAYGLLQLQNRAPRDRPSSAKKRIWPGANNSWTGPRDEEDDL